MPMTMVVTRDVEARYRGFLASAMLEVAPGVYVSPDLSAGVRERIWTVVEDWFTTLGNGAVAMIWRDTNAAGGLALRHLGDPPNDIWDADGVLLVKRS
ncbi:MAG: type I-E CRISPR-associated endoribonuclease Cas2e [Acidobacteriota bacterium]|nr:type I-E CRISPR-associated endoribonuclease Cas2e [Acidobacteriota bacterium]